MAEVNTRDAPEPAVEEPVSSSRLERKQRTRAALLDAALELLEDHGFDSLSLREVTRRAGVSPAAFYRHFDGMEELGLALVDESFRALRTRLRETWAASVRYEQMIRSSVEILIGRIQADRLHFRFIARERSGGVLALRRAIRSEIRLFRSELATDLARFPATRDWSTEDLTMLAGVIVNAMVSTAEEVIDLPEGDEEGLAVLAREVERQVRLIALGTTVWRSRAPAVAPTGASEGEESA